VRTLRREDIIACIKALVELARRQGRDRRYRPSRQPSGTLGWRTDGEPVPAGPSAHGARDPRTDELGRDRHGDAAGPDQRQARRGGGARILRLFAAFAVHGPDEPAFGSDTQAAPVRSGAGRSDARTRGLRGARRAPHPLRPDVPDRDARRAEHRADQLACHFRAREQVRLHRDALSQSGERAGDRRGHLSVGHRGNAAHHRPGECQSRCRGAVRQ
jgi:hypothetical protein